MCSAQAAQPTVQQVLQPVPVPPLSGHVIDQTHTLTSDQQSKIE